MVFNLMELSEGMFLVTLLCMVVVLNEKSVVNIFKKIFIELNGDKILVY